MNCEICQHETDEDDAYNHRGQVLCEDCYMKALNPVNTCDPVAVRAAVGLRGNVGAKGAEGLTPHQKEIYEFITNKGKVTALEITVKFGITLQDLNRTVATLRHCELVRGQKEGEDVFLVPF